MNDLKIPKLQIKGTHTPAYDLSRLIFHTTAKKSEPSKRHLETPFQKVNHEKFDPQRLAFLIKLHATFSSYDSIATRISHANRMIKFLFWCDQNYPAIKIDRDSFKKAFRDYDNYLYRRVVQKEIKSLTAVLYLSSLSSLANKLFNDSGIKKSKELLAFSKCVNRYKSPAKRAVSPRAEKQSFNDTQALGNFCVDVCLAINNSAILGPLPITYRSEFTSNEYLFTSKLKDLHKHHTNTLKAKEKESNNANQKHLTYLARLRVDAELLIFLFNTGMNLSQAVKLKRLDMKYNSSGDSEWKVTAYKARAHHTVEFYIFKPYRRWLKSYLTFCDKHYPSDPYLFPDIPKLQRDTGNLALHRLLHYIKAYDIPWVSPSIIRKTRVNFILRSSGNPELAANIHQHSVMTMKSVYALPSQQKAASALTAFWKGNPISRIKGGCDHLPKATFDKPVSIVEPNCINASGCLWCVNHRDIKSLDYIWSLASFRRLKLYEATQVKDKPIPSDLVIQRLNEKLNEFEKTSQDWVEEALFRVNEGDYHPTWKALLNFLEGE